MRARGLGAAIAMGLLARVGLACGDDAASSVAASTAATATDDASLDDSSDAGGVISSCSPGEVRPCYEGPPGTEGLGACQAGEQTCTEDGQHWSACTGQVWPQPAESCATPQDDDCDGTALCEPTLTWWTSVDEWPAHVAMSSLGHTIVAGTTQGFIVDDQLLVDVYLVAYDAEGDVLWARSVSVDGTRSVLGLAVDEAGRITIVGHYEGTPDFGRGPLPAAPIPRAYVAQFAVDGTPLWSQGHDAEIFGALALGPDGSIQIVGSGSEIGPFEDFTSMLVVTALESDGTLRWTKEVRGVLGLSVTEMSIARSPTDEVLVLATMMAEPGGVAEYDGLPIDASNYGAVLLRLASDGTLLDTVRPYDEQVQGVEYLSVLARPDGTLTLVGNAWGTWEDDPGQTVLVQHRDASLGLLKELRLGNPSWSYTRTLTPQGSTVLGLAFGGSLDLGPIGVSVPQYGAAIAITEVDDAGQARWLELLHGVGYLQLNALAVGHDGAIALSANVSDPTTLGGEPVTGGFLAVLRP